MELVRKMFLHVNHEPEICVFVCSFVSWAGEVLFCRTSAAMRCFSPLCCCSGTCIRKPSALLRVQSEQFG